MARHLGGAVLFRVFTAELTDIGRLLDVVETPWPLRRTTSLSSGTTAVDAELRLRPKLRGSVLVAQVFGLLPAFTAAGARCPPSTAVAFPPTMKLRRCSVKSGLLFVPSD